MMADYNVRYNFKDKHLQMHILNQKQYSESTTIRK